MKVLIVLKLPPLIIVSHAFARNSAKSVGLPQSGSR